MVNAMSALDSNHSCDPNASELAKAVFETLAPAAVILFGSRARGDFREDSDIDLLVVADFWEASPEMGDYFSKLAKDFCGSDVNIQWNRYTEAHYLWYRRAPVHFVGRATKEGVFFSANSSVYSNQVNERPDNWPEVKQRLQKVHEHLQVFNQVLEQEPEILNHPQATSSRHQIVEAAEPTIKDSLRAWLAALDVIYDHKHGTKLLSEELSRFPEEEKTQAGVTLRWLLNNATYLFDEAQPPVDSDFIELQRMIGGFVERVADRASDLTGHHVSDLAASEE